MAIADISSLISEKYATQRYAADAEANARIAAANIGGRFDQANTQARTNAQLAERNLQNRGTLAAIAAGGQTPENLAQADYYSAQARTANQAADTGGFVAGAPRGGGMPVSSSLGTSTLDSLSSPRGLGWLTSPTPMRQQDTGLSPARYAKGTARVPGKGDGTKDTVKAKLAPGEAVLNKPAAEDMGRGLIAALNQMGAKKMGMI